jgi:uncharacterized membrane protein YjgN (DUF898 family)
MSATGETASVERTARNTVRFLGEDRDYWRLMIRGAVLLLVTLGIYRFWLVTDMRRFLWSQTEVGGDGLEYAGTPLELLIGFLIAVTLLVPLYGGFFVFTLGLGPLGQLSGLLAFVLLAFLGHFAVYRARRYRLTRTIYRGLRFRQTGSAWRYSVCAVFWWVMIVFTLGLAYPWAQARLEQYKMSNTYYGDLPGHFEGTAASLFWRGVPLWLAVVGPFVAGIVIAVRRVNWSAALDVAAQGGDDVLARIEGVSPGIGAAVVIGVLAAGWAVLAAALLYPAFQAVTLRWWLTGLRFGSVAAHSQLRVRQVYGVYVRFLWYALLVSLVGGLGALLVFFIIGLAAKALTSSAGGEIVVTVLLVAGYVVAALAFSTIYQVTVRLGLWRVGAQSLVLSGVNALDRVKAVGRPSSSVGEGLADALQVGGW